MLFQKKFSEEDFAKGYTAGFQAAFALMLPLFNQNIDKMKNFISTLAVNEVLKNIHGNNPKNH